MDNQDTCPSSNSVQTVVTSLVANGAFFLIFVALFIYLRPYNKQIYDSRITSAEVMPRDKPRELSSGYFSWFKDLMTRPDSEVVRDAGLDGYFFLRYLRFLFYICMLGIVILLPILLPVNATNGRNCNGFDLLAFGNITNVNRYYAHVFLSWIFFGLVLFFIYRETCFYIGTRQAVLTTEAESGLLSNRTVLINDIPPQQLNEEYLTSLFHGVKYVFLSRDAKKLQKAVEEREKLAAKLEGATNGMLKKAMKKRLKAEKKQLEVSDDITQYVKPPTHRLGKIPFFGEKVDTIEYCKKRIPELNEEIDSLRQGYKQNEKRAAAFIVFDTQFDAEVCAQTLSYHKPLMFAPKAVGVRPDEVIWSNLSLRWKTRLPKSLGAATFCTVLVIFWAIPVAFAGFISQIETLKRLFPWLSFLDNLPKVLYGLISSLLPQIVLAVLMMLLPPVIRLAARTSGCSTNTEVEYYTQNVYFAFQVFQVFIVTTLSSSIIAALKDILDDPGYILDYLHSNLPRASNFFMSYMLLQALTIPSGAILQLVAVIIYYVLGALLDNTPRKMWNRRNAIGGPGWGTVYPIYSNMAVITLCYSIISPLILPFSAALFLFVYIANLNNLTFCTAKTNGRGIYYMRGLKHLFVGIYLAEIVLIILFVFSKSWGPLVLEVVFGLFTIYFQVHLFRAFNPMLYSLPKSLLNDVEMSKFKQARRDPFNDVHSVDKLNSNHQGQDQDQDQDQDAKDVKTSNEQITLTQTTTNQSELPNDMESQVSEEDKPNGKLMQRIFKPYLYCTPQALSRTLLTDSNWNNLENKASEEFESSAFEDPAVNAGSPIVWFPADPYGWAEAKHQEFTDAGINAHTEGSELVVNEKFKAKLELDKDGTTAPLYSIPESI